MSEIEVLTVPDERLNKEGNEWPEGTVVVRVDNAPMPDWTIISRDMVPALLAALLEQAGAERESVTLVYDELNMRMAPAPLRLPIGEYYVLPAPEDETP